MSTVAVPYTSPAFGCGALTWQVQSNDDRLLTRVTELYASCATPSREELRSTFTLVALDSVVRIERDGVTTREGMTPELAVAHLAWEVNAAVVAANGSALLVHGAAAVADRGAVVIAGPQGSGKSTLVAALVRAGLAYVTDEVVIVDRQRGLITPYPKPIALEPPSWAVLPELVAPAATEHEWLVAPQSIGAGRVAHDPAPPVLVVLPSYQPGASSRCEPISRADAALALCRESFNFHDLAPGRLDVVAGVVRGAQCFTLAYGDAHAAARNVVAELAKSAS